MLRWILNFVHPLRARFESARLRRRWNKLRAMGMHIGQGVNLPASTWIDNSHCFLISIGDWCGFGQQCLILAHDAQMDEFLDASLIGKVTIHESCHFGSRTVILPGVEVGPRTIVGANAVVANSLPPDTVCAGIPAKVICSLDEYLAKHEERLSKARPFPWTEYNLEAMTPERLAEIRAAVEEGPAYITGGFSEELRGLGATDRTPHDDSAKPTGVEYWKRRQRARRPV
jgi:maltose O-acetyltransferase